jgi:uncharacterized protein (DUF1697 family)
MTVRYAVMLRGINVGGNRKLPMADLRVLLTELGYGRVETYIQSGNVALDALPLNDTGGDATELAETLAGQISERFGFEVPVVVRTHAELEEAVAASPYAGRGGEAKQVHMAFAQREIPAERITPKPGSRDEFVVRGREIHIWTPDGLGVSKLPDFDRQGGVPVTARNWNTVLKLLEMTAG